MARKKVKLAFIENDPARKVTYKKRAKGLVKKTQELSVLCDVEACTVIYSPYDKAPVVWPTCETEAKRILMEYKRKPEMDQSQRRLNQLAFLKQILAKYEEKLLKLQRRNREMEIEILMAKLLNGKPIEQVSFNDLGDLLWVVEDKIRAIQHRIQVLKGPTNIKNNIGPFFNQVAIGHANYHLANRMMMNNMIGERAAWDMGFAAFQGMNANGWNFSGPSKSAEMN